MKFKRDAGLFSLLLFLISCSASGMPASGGTAVPVFSVKHGFYSTSFNLEIKSTDRSALIYYTTDGSLPSSTGGNLYRDALVIRKTTVVRAVCVKNSLAGNVITNTYVFVDDVLKQPALPEGYPASWGPYTAIAGTAVADYEMDPELVRDEKKAADIRKALLSLPVISLSTNREYLFSHSRDKDSGGIYIYTGPPLTNTSNGTGFGWERPVSFELFDASDSVSLQVDCGIQIQGGHGRRPEKSPKHSFRLIFKNLYGPGRLEFPLFGSRAVSEFNTIVLRAGFGNTWVHWSHSERFMTQYMRDRWTKDTHSAMGHRSSQGFYAHLFLNGLYWGIYNPSERLDKEYAASYLQGRAEDFDVIKDYAEVVDGNIAAWHKAVTIANAGLATDEAYNKFIGQKTDGSADPLNPAMVDPVSLADYMILNFYGGNWDWDHHNWVAIRNRVNPGKGFQFFCWDGEHMVDDLSSNVTGENNSNCPSRIFQQMLKNMKFKRLFADRVQKFCFSNGVLTPGAVRKRWQDLGDIVGKAIDAESARWGDYRRDVHRWQSAGPFMLYTKEDHWIPQMNYMLDTYIPSRTEVFISQLRSASLFPKLDAPVFLINGILPVDGTVRKGDILTVEDCEGQVYYTIDGSDPVIWGMVPALSASARLYSGSLELTRSVRIKAVKVVQGDWSAINDQLYTMESDLFNIDKGHVVSAGSVLTVYQNYPNPFSERTKIPYVLGTPSEIEISVFDLNGKEVIMLENGFKDSGIYISEWNGKDSFGTSVNNGVYLVRIRTRSSDESLSRSYRVILMR